MRLGLPRGCGVGGAALVVYLAIRLDVGIDAASPELTKYFRTLVWAELVVIGAGTSLWWGWLVRTGRRLIDQAVTPDEEVRRIAVFWGLSSSGRRRLTRSRSQESLVSLRPRRGRLLVAG